MSSTSSLARRAASPIWWTSPSAPRTSLSSAISRARSSACQWACLGSSAAYVLSRSETFSIVSETSPTAAKAPRSSDRIWAAKAAIDAREDKAYSIGCCFAQPSHLSRART